MHVILQELEKFTCLPVHSGYWLNMLNLSILFIFALTKLDNR